MSALCAHLTARLASVQIDHCTPKLAYFAVFATNACILPFMTLIFEARGLTKSQIGSVVAFVPLARFVFAPVWTYVADRYQRHFAVSVASYLASAFTLLLFFLSHTFAAIIFSVGLYAALSSAVMPLIDARVLRILGPSRRQAYGAQRLWGALSWGVNSALIGALADAAGGDVRIFFYSCWLCGLLLLGTLRALFSERLESEIGDNYTASGVPVDSWRPFQLVAAAEPAATEDGQTEQYASVQNPSAALAPVATVSGDATLPKSTIVDSECLDQVEIHGSNTVLESPPSSADNSMPECGQLAAQQADSTAHVAAAARDIPTDEQENDENNAVADESMPAVHGEINRAPVPLSFCASLGLILAAPFSWLILAMCLFLGFGMSIVFYYLFLFLHDDLGASHTLLGLSVSMTVVFEFPFFLYSERLLALLGLRGMLLLAFGAYVSRVLVYTLLSNPWLVLLVEPCHGITFACSWCAVIHYSGSVAPPGLEATTQGVFNGVFNGFGPALGAAFGGVLYQHYGAVVMFRVAATVLSAAAAVFFVATRSCCVVPRVPAAERQDLPPSDECADAKAVVDHEVDEQA